MSPKYSPFYSIIIPIYNSELYLNSCIESIINQDFKDFELILVDDGSQDNSLAICKDWAEKDTRIIVLAKENGGQGSARNAGLKQATGDYVMFIDSDDTISLDTLSKNHEILIENPGIDCLQFPIYMNYGTDKAYIRAIDVGVISEVDDIVNATLKKGLFSWIVCDKIFKRSFFDEYTFREDIVYEDNFMMMEIIQAFNKVYCSNQGMYYYYHRADSTTTSVHTLHKEKSTMEVLFLIMSIVISLNDKDLMHKYLLRVINVGKSLKVNFKFITPDFKQFKNHLKFKEILLSKETIVNKVKLLLYKYG